MWIFLWFWYFVSASSQVLLLHLYRQLIHLAIIDAPFAVALLIAAYRRPNVLPLEGREAASDPHVSGCQRLERALMATLFSW